MKLRLNITAKLVGYLLAAGIVPLLALGFSAFQMARGIVIEQASEYNVKLASDAASYLRLYLNQVEDLAANIAGNEGIARALSEADRKPPGSYETLNTRAQIGYILNNFVRVKGLVSLDLFTITGKHYYIGQTLSVSEVKLDTIRQMMKETEASSNAVFWRGVEDNINTASAQRKVITLTRVIRHYAPESGTDTTVGLLAVNLSNEIFRDYFPGGLPRDDIRIMAIDRHGRLMHHWDNTLIGRPLTSGLLDRVRNQTPSQQLRLDGEEVILTRTPLSGLDGYMIFVTPLALYTAPVNRLATAGVVLLLIGLAGIALLSRHYVRTLVVPLRSVSDRFRHLRENPGDVHTPLPVPREQDEIATLISGFNSHIEALEVQRDATAKLEEALAFNTAIILASPIPTGVYAATGSCVLANEAYAHAVDSTRDLLQAQDFNRIAAWRESGLLDVCLAALSRGESRRKEINVQLNFDKDAWFDCQIQPLTLNGARHLLIQFYDLTEARRLAGAMQQAMKAAEAASVAKSRFLATMSHEIRTPMNGMLGMAQMLLTPGLDDDKRQDYARTILTSGQTLLTLLNDILDVSKVEAGKLTLESIALDPAQVIHETHALLADLAGRKGLQLESDWHGSSGQRYLGDPHRLRQMLSNLAGNAIKFTAQGRVCIEAREIERDDRTAILEFAVTDTGIGIAEDKHSMLFLPFSQADDSTTRQYGGTGLGLAIVCNLARLMGGTVGVESIVGRGSRFWFRIRADVLAPGLDTRQADRTAVPDPVLRENATQMSGRVLVAEDNLTNRRVVESLLSKFGLSVVLTENGQQCLDAITGGEAADLILMDLEMPVMDGYAAAARIRQWETQNARPRLPIIALTGHAFEENRQHCLAVGMDDFLTKPVSTDALEAALGRWLRPVPANSRPAATPASAGMPVDVPRVRAILHELDSLLAQNRFDAVSRFRDLQEAVAGTDAAADIAQAMLLLQEFRFDAVRERLRRIALAHDWEGPTS